jgi:hypothetical protein
VGGYGGNVIGTGGIATGDMDGGANTVDDGSSPTPVDAADANLGDATGDGG